MRHAWVAELVYAGDLKSPPARGVGSIPTEATDQPKENNMAIVRLSSIETHKNSRYFGILKSQFKTILLNHLKELKLIPEGSTIASWEFNKHFDGFYVNVDLPGGRGDPYMPDERKEEE